jgi:molybdate transport system substrate-binding protein
MLLLAGCADSGGAATERVVVSAAASLQTALTDCAAPGVRLSFGGSDELAAQIRRGVRPDVYVAANAELPRALAGEGLLDAPVAFATNELVLATPAGSPVAGLGDLARPGTAVVVGGEDVPVGAYTRTVLDRLAPAQARAIRANVRSEEPDVRGIVGKLGQRAADAGFVYRTDVTAAGGRLRAVTLPARLRPVVIYAAGTVTGAPNPDGARRYLEGLRSGACGRALRAAGFGPPPS